MCAKLNDLIRACEASALVHERSSAAVRETAWLMECAAQRRSYVSELGREVRACGGRPARASAIRAHIDDAALAVSHALIGSHEGDAYLACARSDRDAEDRYAKVLQSPLSDEVRILVSRQHEEIGRTSHLLQRRRFGATS